MANITIHTNSSAGYITSGGCNYYLDVEMLCVNGVLFIVTKKGALRDTDTIHLFRYSRTRTRLCYNRNKNYEEFDYIEYHRIRTGWQIPMQPDRSPAVNLVMHKLDSTEAKTYNIEKIASVKDVWLVEGEDGTTLNAICENGVYINNDTQLILTNKKLGLRIKRGAEWITDYIHFMYKKNCQGEDRDGNAKYSYGIGRWAR